MIFWIKLLCFTDYYLMKKKKLVIIIVIFSGPLLLSCFTNTKSAKIFREIEGVEIIHTISPSIGPGNESLKRSDTLSVKILFWKDQILYSSDHLNYYMKNGKDIDKVESEKFIFVREGNSPAGHYFDLYNNKSEQIINADSFLKHEWYAQIKLHPIFLESDYKLISSDRKDNRQIENYSLRGRGIDSNKTGTISLIYSNESKIQRISLSKELDTVNGKKLVSTKIVTNARELVEQRIGIPKFETSYIIRELDPVAEKGLYKYFIDYNQKQ